MYIQITTKCNFHCPHCCFSCTAKGRNMSLKTFQAAIDVAENYGESISIGGGEPTLHPLFWQFLGMSIATFDSVWLATNGSQTKTALSLARMAKKGVIGCALSIDPYHDPIDESVIQAFTKDNDSHSLLYPGSSVDCREIRNTSKNIENMSLWRDHLTGNKNVCPCPDIFVKPDGSIRLCGCHNSPVIGNVLSNFDFNFPEEYDVYSCYKQLNVAKTQ